MDINIRYSLGFQACLDEPDTWTKPPIKYSVFKYYEYISNHIDEGMDISNDCDMITKGLEETYTLGGVKVMFDKKTCYLVATVGLYYTKNYCGGEN